MMEPRKLRVYFGPQDDQGVAREAASVRHELVTVDLSEVFPLLADAIRSDRTWLQDFADDQVTISSDLYDVLLAYQHYRRPAS